MDRDYYVFENDWVNSVDNRISNSSSATIGVTEGMDSNVSNTQSDKFNGIGVGDVVRLKSGSPNMVVDSICPSRNQVRVVYYDTVSGLNKDVSLSVYLLEIVKTDIKVRLS